MMNKVQSDSMDKEQHHSLEDDNIITQFNNGDHIRIVIY